MFCNAVLPPELSFPTPFPLLSHYNTVSFSAWHFICTAFPLVSQAALSWLLLSALLLHQLASFLTEGQDSSNYASSTQSLMIQRPESVWVILLSAARSSCHSPVFHQGDKLVDHEFFQFCYFFWLLNLYCAGLGMWFSRLFHISGYPHELFISIEFILFHISTSIPFLSSYFSFMSFLSQKNCNIFSCLLFFFFLAKILGFTYLKWILWKVHHTTKICLY